MRKNRKVPFIKSRIKEEMKKHGQKQQDIADLLFLDLQTIRAAFRDELLLPEYIEELAKYYNVSPYYFEGLINQRETYVSYETGKYLENTADYCKQYLQSFSINKNAPIVRVLPGAGSYKVIAADLLDNETIIAIDQYLQRCAFDFLDDHDLLVCIDQEGNEKNEYNEK